MNKYLLTILTLSANLLLTGCADDQARVKLAETDARLSALEQKVGQLSAKVSNQSGLDLLNKLDDLQSQIEQLNGETSTLKQNQQNYQATQEQVNRSMQDQIQSNSNGSQTGKHVDNADGEASVATPTNNIAVNSSNDNNINSASNTDTPQDNSQSQLNMALKRLKAHDFDNAIKQFRAIITKTKDHQIMSKANYYLAVAYVATKQYKNAIIIARKVVVSNPDDVNAPDAMRIIYISQTNLGLTKSANITANTLIRKYPNSDAAKKIK